MSRLICKRYNKNDYATSNDLDKPKNDADFIVQMSASVSIHFKKTSAHRVAQIPIQSEGHKFISTQCQKDYFREIKKSAYTPSFFVNVAIAQVHNMLIILFYYLK